MDIQTRHSHKSLGRIDMLTGLIETLERTKLSWEAALDGTVAIGDDPEGVVYLRAGIREVQRRIQDAADAMASAIVDRQEYADAARTEAWHELRLHLATEIGTEERATWEAARGIVTETETVDEIAEAAADYTIATEDGAVIAEVSHIDLTAPAGVTVEEPTLGEIAQAHAAAGKHNRKRKTFDVARTKKGDWVIHPAGKRRQPTRVPDYRDVENFLEAYCGETHWPNIRQISHVA